MNQEGVATERGPESSDGKEIRQRKGEAIWEDLLRSISMIHRRVSFVLDRRLTTLATYNDSSKINTPVYL